jgi:hypothetical protein
MTSLRIMLALSCLLQALPCTAGPIVLRSGSATLEISAEEEKPRLALSDTIEVTLKIEVRPEQVVELPEEWPATSKWLLVEPARIKRTKISPDRIRQEYHFRFAPREPGDISFEFPDVQIREGQNRPETMTWKKVSFTITTQITQPEQTALREITDIEVSNPVPPEPASWLWWLLTGLVLPVVGVGYYVVRRLWRRRAVRSPVERALYEWQRLVAMKLPERGRVERFITEGVFTAEEKHFLAEFLQRCDAVKYAGVEMTASECYACAEQVRVFLDRRQNVPIKKPGQEQETLPIEKIGQTG